MEKEWHRITPSRKHTPNSTSEIKSAPTHPRETLSKRKLNLAPASLFPSRQPAQKDGKGKTNATYDWRCKLPRTLGDCKTASTAWENCRPNLKATSEIALTLTKLSWETRWAPVKASIKAVKSRSVTAKMYQAFRQRHKLHAATGHMLMHSHGVCEGRTHQHSRKPKATPIVKFSHCTRHLQQGKASLANCSTFWIAGPFLLGISGSGILVDKNCFKTGKVFPLSCSSISCHVCTFPTSTSGVTSPSDMKDSKVLRWDWAFGVSCSKARVSGSFAGVTGSELGFKIFLSFWISAMSLSSLA